MLILTRRPGQTIMIGAGDSMITVTVLGVLGSSVKIGVNAPAEVAVDREEIRARKDNEIAQAAPSTHTLTLRR